jgi:hypothetical protein
VSFKPFLRILDLLADLKTEVFKLTLS